MLDDLRSWIDETWIDENPQLVMATYPGFSSIPLLEARGEVGKLAGLLLQCLLGPASQKPPMQQSSLARLFEQKKSQILRKMDTQICIRPTQDVQGNTTYLS